PGLDQLQGGLAVLAAAMAAYLALALVGRAPSPEVFLGRLTARWGRAMQHLTATTQRGAASPPAAFILGLVWGLLPCGLVLTALLTAAVAGSPWRGALTMLAFGLGTWPALLGAGWLVQQGLPRALPWPRQIAALVVFLFGAQMALRGLAAWGWVSHVRFGQVMVW
ncbi:MAG: sulfite exporter TauE/SafE family protein, partial [Anaerolineae bacterium]